MSDEEERRRRQSIGIVTPRVRYRSRLRQVLNFSNAQVDRTMCMPDKLTVTFPQSRISCRSQRVLNTFLENISGDNNLLTLPRTLGQKIKCKFRKNFCPFLYGSYLLIERDDTTSNEYSLSIRLNFNPSRFLANAAGHTRSLENFVGFDSVINGRVKEASLDRNDNFINYEAAAIKNYLNREEAEEGNPTLMDLLEELTDWLRTYLTSRANIYNITFDFDWSNWKLNHAEVYYEFASPDAFQAMKYISPHIPALYRETLFRHYLNDLGEEEDGADEYTEEASPQSEIIDVTRKDNSMMIRVPLGNKITLVIYPKTREVLRFEIRRSESLRVALPAIMPDNPLLFIETIEWRERRRRVRNSIGTELDNIEELLSIFGNHLATTIETIYSNIHQRIGSQTYDYDILPAFLRALDVISPNTTVADFIWSSFAANGFIRTNRNSTNRIMRTLRVMCRETTYVVEESTLIVGEKDYVFRLCPELLETMRSMRLDPTFGILDELSADQTEE